MWILIAFIVLIKCTYDDIQTRYVNLSVIGIGLTIALITNYICRENGSIKNTVISIVPGVILLFFSKAIKGIGEGDAYVFIFTGIMCGYYDIIVIMFISFILSFIYALFLTVIKKVNKNYSYPFVPFILLGFIICEAVNIYRGVLL